MVLATAAVITALAVATAAVVVAVAGVVAAAAAVVVAAAVTGVVDFCVFPHLVLPIGLILFFSKP